MTTIKQFNDYGKTLEDLLLLRTSPIAVKMIEKEADIPDGAFRPKRDRGYHYSQCQAFALSRRERKTVAMLKEDNWCPAPVTAYGLDERPERPDMRPGEALSVTLTWTVQDQPGRDYAVFVHLADDQSQVWGYGDSAPRQGNYPTWWWEPGEVVVDEHILVPALDTPPGRYRVSVGLYDQSGRVPVYGVDGSRAPDDAVDLGQVEVW